MKNIATKLCIVCASLIIFGLILTGVSNAKIDPNICIGLWLFDEDKGDVAKDSSKNGKDGKLISGSEWADGKFGKAVKFNGAGDHVLVDEVEIPQNNWSITSWVSRIAPLGGIWISHNKSRTNNNNLHLFSEMEMAADQKLIFTVML